MRIEIISIIIGLFMYLIFYFLFGYDLVNSLIPAIIIGSIPLLIYNYLESKREEEIEAQFTRFALDLAHLLKSGLSMKAALEQISNADYRILNPYVKRLYARISWGIDLKTSFNILAEEIGVEKIKRIIKVIIEIYESGGSLDKGLESSINTLLEINRLKEERKTLIHENILDSFVVFVFYLGIIATFSIFLLPFMSGILSESQEGKINIDYMNFLFYVLSILQSIFGGLALGKMYSGSYRYGVRFVIIFLLLTVILFQIIIPLAPKGSNIMNIFGLPS